MAAPRNLAERSAENERYQLAKFKWRKLGYVFQISFYGEYATLEDTYPRRVEILKRTPFQKHELAFLAEAIRKAPPPFPLTLMIYDPPQPPKIVHYVTTR
jgi:hypothetical protein